MENERPITSTRVAANVREIRKSRGLDLSDVSERLARLGQPISVSGLSKLETGSRRVDVDDLVALAIVLDVSPARLLLTATARNDEPVELTPKGTSNEFDAWWWATGRIPLPVDTQTEGATEISKYDRLGRFLDENQPHAERDRMTLQDVREHSDALMELADAAQIAQEKTKLPVISLVGYIEHVESIRQNAESLRAKYKSVTGEDLDNG